MIVIKKIYFSSVKPQDPNCLWLKPVEGGFTAYLIIRSNETPLKLIDDNGTRTTKDDVVVDSNSMLSSLIGSVQDEKSANTINGAKAYAKEIVDAVIGTTEDTSSDLTLNGIKAYINEQLTEE